MSHIVLIICILLLHTSKLWFLRPTSLITCESDLVMLRCSFKCFCSSSFGQWHELKTSQLLNKTFELFRILQYLFETPLIRLAHAKKHLDFCERKFPPLWAGRKEIIWICLFWVQAMVVWKSTPFCLVKSETLLSFLGNDHNMNICRFWVWTKSNYT